MLAARTREAQRGAAASSARAQRLHRPSDVRAAFAARAAGTPLLVVHGRRREDDGPARVTVVAGKKVGTAVTRNRVKRRLRAVLRLATLPSGYDLVIVGRPTTVRAPFPALRRDLDIAVTKLVRRP